MEYYNNILCVSGSLLVKSDANPHGLISKPMWDKLLRDGANQVRRACYGKSALIEFATLPVKYQELIKQAFGTPEVVAKVKPFADRITPDADAVKFFFNYQLNDGRYLPTEKQKEYSTNASVLNSIKEIYNAQRNAKKALGKSVNGFWKDALVAVNSIRAELKHDLPATEIALKRRYQQYVSEGYYALISKKFCNDNSRKVSADIERLLMSLYTMPNKPFGADVHAMYQLFINNKIQVACQKTGELFNAQDFVINGKPLEISESTVWNYLNLPHNRAVVDAARNGQFQFNTMHRPHHVRKAPQFSFSKVSMDDRDLPRLSTDGKRVKAYYAYDVASGCVIGASYSKFKDEELFIDCMQDMFRLIDKNDFGMPLEVEVENHLVNRFFSDLEMMFPYVRICNPGNSQEKHAEHLNRAKKYGTEKKTQNGIGRWWAKSEAYRVDVDKVNDEFKEKVFTYERLVADDKAAVAQFNNQLHPKQKLYPGKTRWQVLVENMNPNATRINKALVYKSIGDKTITTINRNQYVQVQYQKYQIASINVLTKLAPNDYTVTAHYLPDNEGLINEVYLYQNGNFICKATKVTEYSTAKAEWTADDKEAYTNQAKFVSEFDATIKTGKKELHRIAIMDTETIEKAVEQQVTIVTEKVAQEPTINEILNDYDADDYASRAIENI